MTKNTKCPECGSTDLHQATTAASGGYGPILLPGLSRFMVGPKMHVILCAACGNMRFFAAQDALSRLPGNKQWTPLR